MCGCATVEVQHHCGLDWLGFPWPYRVAAWVLYRCRRGKEPFAEFQAKRWRSCGCIKPLAEAWGSLAWRVARWR